MFSIPVKHVRLESLEELKKFSFQKWDAKAKDPKTFDSNNGQYAYADEFGLVYVTPYRSEIYDLLVNGGYRGASIWVPFSNGEERPEAYKWLACIADEENWHETFEEAYRIAESKGIKPVNMAGISFKQIRDITTEYFDDKEKNRYFTAMTMKYLHNSTSDNIGTYIVVDRNTLMVCDEYGRTYILTIKGTINDFVNRLIEAGYKRASNPEYFIHEYTVDTNQDV